MNLNSAAYHLHGPMVVKIGEDRTGSHLQLSFEGGDIVIFTKIGAKALTYNLISALRGIGSELDLGQPTTAIEVWVGGER